MDWSGIATAYLDRERARLGLPSREDLAIKRAEEQRRAAAAASSLESADLGRKQIRQNMELQPDLVQLRAEAAKAQAEAARARAEQQPRATGPAAILEMTPEQQAAYIDFQKRLTTATRQPKETGAGGVSPSAEANIINRLTTQWDKANATQRELKRQYAMMQEGLNAARRGDMAAGSQAVLVTFQKILDPASVVRESEYARSAAGLSMLSRIEGFAQRLKQGGAGVPIQDLETFANLANEFMRNAGQDSAMVRSRIETTAKRYGIPLETVFGVEQAGGAPAVTDAPPQPPSGDERIINGVLYRRGTGPDGRRGWVRAR
jgi:hypothetical protein